MAALMVDNANAWVSHHPMIQLHHRFLNLHTRKDHPTQVSLRRDQNSLLFCRLPLGTSRQYLSHLQETLHNDRAHTNPSKNRNESGTNDSTKYSTTRHHEDDKDTDKDIHDNLHLSEGRNNFGDIMSPTVDDVDVLLRDGLVTSESKGLEQTYGIDHPLNRIAVTANGNLQRIVSSYYDAPVTVVVDHCTAVVHGATTTLKNYTPKTSMSSISSKAATTPGNAMAVGGAWDRRVQLQVFGTTFCVAESTVHVHSPECQRLVESGAIGLGQLFRYLNLLPEFELQNAGPTPEGGFWRQYTLDCPGMVTCNVHETFIRDVWDLKPKTGSDVS